MAFNTTKRERQRSAARDLALKIKLERELLIDVRDLFNEMARDLRRVYESTGTIIQATSYQDDLQKFLKRHYAKVSRNFKSQIRMGLAKNLNMPLIEHKNIESDIDSHIDTFITEHAATQAQIITDTNQEDIHTSINRIVERNEQEGSNVSQAVIAAAVADEFNRLAQGRSDNIGTTETQSAAEKTKLIEAEALTAATAVVVTRKEWVAILDNNTRLAHAIADGQRKSLTVPFLVNGESLMTPGDGSLGASAANLCNCRCSSVYTV